jgi:uncharacterized membrane protein
MSNVDLGFEGAGGSLLLAFVVVVAAFLFTILFYQRHAKYLTVGSLTTMMLLRVVALLVLLLALFRPVITFERLSIQKEDLLFLFDHSKSMKIADMPGSPSRLRRVQNNFEIVQQLLKDNFDLSYFGFSSVVTPCEDIDAIKQLKPDGDTTNVADAVREVVKEFDRSALAGVIVFTDGNDNSGQNVLEAVRGVKAKIFPIGVGTRLREQKAFKDAFLTGVLFERFLTINTTAEFEILVDAIGFKNAKVPVELRDSDGNVLGSQELVLDDIDGAQKVRFEYRPERRGKYTLEAVVPTLAEETIPENNAQMFEIEVIDAAIKVLYIEGSPRNESKFLMRTLQFDPNVEIASYVQIRQGVFWKRASIEGVDLGDELPTEKEDYEKFDIIMIGDLDYNFFTSAKYKGVPSTIKELVEEGKGFIMIGGTNSFGPGGYGGTAFEEVLPVLCGDRNVGQFKDQFSPTLTADGEVHPIFGGYTHFFATPRGAALENLPPLMGSVILPRAKPGAMVLAVNPKGKNEFGNYPVLAVQQYGKGRSAALAIDSTWRWFFQMKPLGKDSPYIKFWAQLLRWLASRSLIEEGTEMGLTAYVDKSYYEPGEKVMFYGQARGKDGIMTNKAVIHAELEKPEDVDAHLTLRALEAAKGNYEAEFMPPKPGKYVFKVTGELDKEALGDLSVEFVVGRPMVEYEKLDLNEALLKQVALSTGGQYYPLVSAEQLAQGLIKSQKVAREVRKVPQSWNKESFMGVLFGIFVLFITIEWILRKRYDLI